MTLNDLKKALKVTNVLYELLAQILPLTPYVMHVTSGWTDRQIYKHFNCHFQMITSRKYTY